MSWTTPRTWVGGELVTAALMNVHVRDNELDLDARVTAVNTRIDTSAVFHTAGLGNPATGGWPIIYTHPIPANFQGTVRFHPAGVFAANANGKGIRVSLGSAGAVVCQINPATLNGGSWCADLTIRCGTGAQFVSGWILAEQTAAGQGDQLHHLATQLRSLSHTAPINILVEANSAVPQANDVSYQMSWVEYLP